MITIEAVVVELPKDEKDALAMPLVWKEWSTKCTKQCTNFKHIN